MDRWVLERERKEGGGLEILLQRDQILEENWVCWGTGGRRKHGM